MKRSSLLVRMVISIFLVFLILLALVGTFYYQSSSSAIEATIEGNSHDVCRRKWYAAEEKCIMGYGCAIKTKSNNL